MRMLIKNNLTGDEYGFFLYDPQTKHQSSEKQNMCEEGNITIEKIKGKVIRKVLCYKKGLIYYDKSQKIVITNVALKF